MTISAKILSNILDDNAKELMDNINDALLDKVSSKIEEMRKEVVDSIYGEMDESRKKPRGHRDSSEGGNLNDRDLANNRPPTKKITYGDVLAQRLHNARKKGVHK